MILPGVPFTHTILHEARKARKTRNRWIHATLKKIPVQHNLSFCDVPGEIRDGVAYVVCRHGKNGHLGYGARRALNTAGTFIYACKV